MSSTLMAIFVCQRQDGASSDRCRWTSVAWVGQPERHSAWLAQERPVAAACVCKVNVLNEKFWQDLSRKSAIREGSTSSGKKSEKKITLWCWEAISGDERRPAGCCFCEKMLDSVRSSRSERTNNICNICISLVSFPFSKMFYCFERERWTIWAHIKVEAGYPDLSLTKDKWLTPTPVSHGTPHPEGNIHPTYQRSFHTISLLA